MRKIVSDLEQITFRTAFSNGLGSITEVWLNSSNYLLLKILQEAMYLASPTWAKSLTKFNPRIQNFKRVMNLISK